MTAGELILGIDTSCDDTGVGVVRLRGGRATVLANALHTQTGHAAHGGVIPEAASREHLARIDAVLDRALAEADLSLGDITAVAATHGPGLMGSLLVGLMYAKGLAQARGLPFYPVHHLQGHLCAAMGETPPRPPYLALVVSGGHTHLFDVNESGETRLLGATRDDAAGEAFDKVARLLGLGFPGGPAIARAAEEGDPAAVPFKLPLQGQKGYEFSFSGVKTAALLAHQGGAGNADLAASFQAVAVRALVSVTVRAARDLGRGQVLVSGGVAANRALRDAFAVTDLEAHFPPPGLNTDNGAMIALAAAHAIAGGTGPGPLGVPAVPYLPLAE